MNGYNATFTRINRHPRNTFPTQLYSPIYLLPGFQLTLDIAISQLNTTLLVLCTIEQEPLRYLGINITQIYQHIVRIIEQLNNEKNKYHRYKEELERQVINNQFTTQPTAELNIQNQITTTWISNIQTPVQQTTPTIFNDDILDVQVEGLTTDDSNE